MSIRTRTVSPRSLPSSDYGGTHHGAFWQAFGRGLDPSEVEAVSDWYRHAQCRSAEERLLLAIIELAIRDLMTPTTEYGARLREEAREFFFAGLHRGYPFRFEAICEHFDVNVGYVRRKLLAVAFGQSGRVRRWTNAETG